MWAITPSMNVGFFLYKGIRRMKRSTGNHYRAEGMGSTLEAVGQISGNQTMPLIALGTATYPFVSSEDMKSAILHAIELGYRHFDTAALYQSEQPLGEAIAQALQLGIISSRDDLFITSKLWCCDAHAHRVQPALEKTLKNLGLVHLDLYLIHWPVSLKSGNDTYCLPLAKEDLVAMDFKSVWAEMEKCQWLGLSKSIGVSNFSCKKLAELLSFAKIPPAVNQVEINPIWQQKRLREFCNQKGIHVSAYSPLGGRGTLWGSAQVMDCPVLKDMAQAKGKTLSQIALRWAYEQGVSVIVKSFNKERLKENIQILDWSLTEEERRLIDQIPQRRGFPGAEFVCEGGPFKTLEELWDGEI